MITPYININWADDYFESRLDSDLWDNTSDSQKTKALAEATRIINRLAFKGIKLSINQVLQFPRIIITETNNTIIQAEIPDDIKIACVEIAYSLLSGIDVEQEIRNIGTESRSYVASKVIYQANFVHEHFRAGVPSAIAWQYLKPYLVNPLNLTIIRV
jgi:hypothetical protein